MTFPKEFYWGGATAANQFEGGFDEGGKGKAKRDFATAGTADKQRVYTYKMVDGSKGTSTIFEPWPQGATACAFEGEYYPNQKSVDFYHRYKEDIKLMAELGIKMFRMSISWTRIFPKGTEEEPNQAGLEFYRTIFLELKKYEIEPLVTLSHYETPAYLEEKLGGWTNPELIGYFERYAETVFHEYKGLVRYWLTFNEINCDLLMFMFMDEGHLTKAFCQNTFQQLHHMFVASAKAVIKAHEIDPEYQVGCMVAGAVSYPLTPDPKDILFTQQFMQKYVYYCSDVMVRGEYPKFATRLWQQYQTSLIISEDDQRILKAGIVDFYSFSYYSTMCTTVDKSAEKSGKGNLQLGVVNPHLEYTEWGWSKDGLGLRYYLNELYGRYEIPMMVVENGLGYDDVFEADQTIHDPYRIDYMKDNIDAMSGAIDDGVELIAYTPWGIIDLISASTGEMKKRYGVVYVDLDDQGNGTRDRYKKDSFYFYQDVISNNGNY